MTHSKVHSPKVLSFGKQAHIKHKENRNSPKAVQKSKHTQTNLEKLGTKTIMIIIIKITICSNCFLKNGEEDNIYKNPRLGGEIWQARNS